MSSMHKLRVIVSLLGHLCSLHFMTSTAGPNCEQSLPPIAGKGLVQDLVLVILPPPQVAEQADQLPNGE